MFIVQCKIRNSDKHVIMTILSSRNKLITIILVGGWLLLTAILEHMSGSILHVSLSFVVDRTVSLSMSFY